MKPEKKSMLSFFIFEKDDAVKTGRFLLYFMLAYLIMLGLVNWIGIQAFEQWVASNVLFLLQLFGHSGQVTVTETALIHLESGVVIEISELCTGLTELMIIVGAILGSAGIFWKKRVLGAAVAGVIAIVFNHFRIVATSLLILGSTDIELIDFTHNVLFRTFLFATVAGLYIAWFYWAVGSEMKAKKILNNRKT